MMGLAVAAIIASAAVLHYAVERPAREYFRRRIRGGRAVAEARRAPVPA